MSTLAKTNPLATRQSAARHAVLFGSLAVLTYGAVCIWYPGWRELWLLKVFGAGALGAALGALLEWQLDDGMEIYWVVREVEEDFGIEIPPAEWTEIDTVGDLYECVIKHAQLDGSRNSASDFQAATWDRLRSLLATQLSVAPEVVTKTARFYLDLPL